MGVAKEQLPLGQPGWGRNRINSFVQSTAVQFTRTNMNSEAEESLCPAGRPKTELPVPEVSKAAGDD